jgi:hypothetical protein
MKPSNPTDGGPDPALALRAAPEEVAAVPAAIRGKVTPGPWDAGSRVIEVAGSDFTPIDAAECTVAFVPLAHQANARLIAAAPELYEALDQLHRETVFFLKREGKEVGKTGVGRSLYDKVERALAKARGDA